MSLFLAPTDAYEIQLLIKNLKMKSNSSPNDIPSKFVKIASCIVSNSSTNVSTYPNYIFNQWQLAFSYLLNPFLSATALTNEISSFVHINQFGSISTSFWRCPLKSVRRKALGSISYFTPTTGYVAGSLRVVLFRLCFSLFTLTISQKLPLFILLYLLMILISICQIPVVMSFRQLLTLNYVKLTIGW